MPSGKNLDQTLMPTFSFGEISRDEINTVLSIAGVSLTPPKKTPFATGIQRKRRTIIKPAEQNYAAVSTTSTPTVSVVTIDSSTQLEKKKELEPTAAVKKQPVEKPVATENKLPVVPSITTPVERSTTPVVEEKKKEQPQQQKPQQQAQQQAQQQTNKKEAKQNTEQAAPAAIATPVTTTAASSAISPSSTSTTSTTTTATTTTVEPPSPQPKVKPQTSATWASLVKKTDADKPKQSSAALATGPTANGRQQQQQQQPSSRAANKPNSPTPASLPKFVSLTDIVSKYEPSYSPTLVQPRGLYNSGNSCYMNVILQPLLHTAPFYNLIKTIESHSSHSMKSKTPLLDSIVEFVKEFQIQRADNPEKPYGAPFTPKYVYEALRGQKRMETFGGRQEDSEEFLCYLLDGLHEEMTSVLKEQHDIKEAEAVAAAAAAAAAAVQTNSHGSGEGWLEVGAKNKTSNVRSSGAFDESPISKIFSGKLRSVLRCPGTKDSINLEPFQSLPLDIQPDNVRTIEDSIANMVLPETMHDFTSPKGLKVDATKQVFLESVPPVLILHMKRFVFDATIGGVQKLLKQVSYGTTLTIRPEWMPASVRPAEPLTYQLVGSVYHIGGSAGVGHYTCDVKRKTGEWIHINDQSINPTTEKDVIVASEEDNSDSNNTRTTPDKNSECTAYILFYVRVSPSS